MPRGARPCYCGAPGAEAPRRGPRPDPDGPVISHAPADGEGLRWATDAAQFDTWSMPAGNDRCRLETGAFSVGGVACPIAASFVPDWAEWRALAGPATFSHQLNVRLAPAGPEAQRRLRKHLAQVALLAADGTWPERMHATQRQAVDGRLASPWLVDELLAADDPGLLARLQRGLRQRLHGLGGPACADSALDAGRFDELWLTGLDGATFGLAAGTDRHLVEAGHSVATEPLRRLLAEPADSAAADDTAPRPIDCFISHTSSDAGLAGRLCEALEALGLRCWIAPRDIPAGHSYAEGIMTALRRSRALLLLLSPAALASQHVQRELERAVSLRCKVLPLRLAAVQPQGAFEYLLSGCQWTDALPGADLQPVVARLHDGLAPRG